MMPYKIKNLIKKLKENGGASLVEVVVSMFILTIMVAPLLNSFVVASRANAEARVIQYANQTAEDVMETVNSIGKDDNPNPALNKMMLHNTSIGRTINMTLPSSTGNSISYVINDISMGTGTYDVVVKYDSSAYEGDRADGTKKINETLPPDISTFAAENSMTVYSDDLPFDAEGGSGGTSYRNDEFAINDFYEEYRNGILEIRNNIQAEYNNRLRTAQQNGAPAPAAPALPTAYYPKDAIQAKIKKELTVRVKYTRIGGEIEVSVRPEVKYTLTEVDYEAYNDTDWQNSVWEGTFNSDVMSNGYYDVRSDLFELKERLKVSKEWNDFYDEKTQKNVENIYLMFSQSDFMSTDKVNLAVEHDASVEVNEMNARFFVVIQKEDEVTAAVTLNVTGDQNFKFYSNAPMSLSVGGISTQRLYLDDQKAEKLYDVTVTVYNQGTASVSVDRKSVDIATGNALAVIKSTFTADGRKK